MIEELAARAVDRWPVSVADIGFVAARENVIFKVTSRDGQAFALRAHRPGYRSDVAIASELEWMAALADGGIALRGASPCTGFLVLPEFEREFARWGITTVVNENDA